MGGWPILEGESWNEKNFMGWEKQILAFRRYINQADDNIFNTKRGAKDDTDVRLPI